MLGIFGAVPCNDLTPMNPLFSLLAAVKLGGQNLINILIICALQAYCPSAVGSVENSPYILKAAGGAVMTAFVDVCTANKMDPSAMGFNTRHMGFGASNQDRSRGMFVWVPQHDNKGSVKMDPILRPPITAEELERRVAAVDQKLDVDSHPNSDALRCRLDCLKTAVSEEGASKEALIEVVQKLALQGNATRVVSEGEVLVSQDSFMDKAMEAAQAWRSELDVTVPSSKREFNQEELEHKAVVLIRRIRKRLAEVNGKQARLRVVQSFHRSLYKLYLPGATCPTIAGPTAKTLVHLLLEKPFSKADIIVRMGAALDFIVSGKIPTEFLCKDAPGHVLLDFVFGLIPIMVDLLPMYEKRQLEGVEFDERSLNTLRQWHETVKNSKQKVVTKSATIITNFIPEDVKMIRTGDAFVAQPDINGPQTRVVSNISTWRMIVHADAYQGTAAADMGISTYSAWTAVAKEESLVEKKRVLTRLKMEHNFPSLHGSSGKVLHWNNCRYFKNGVLVHWANVQKTHLASCMNNLYQTTGREVRTALITEKAETEAGVVLLREESRVILRCPKTPLFTITVNGEVRQFWTYKEVARYLSSKGSDEEEVEEEVVSSNVGIPYRDFPVEEMQNMENAALHNDTPILVRVIDEVTPETHSLEYQVLLNSLEFDGPCYRDFSGNRNLKRFFVVRGVWKWETKRKCNRHFDSGKGKVMRWNNN